MNETVKSTRWCELMGQYDRAFKMVYPYLNLGLDVGLLGYDVAYLFDKTDSYRPWHRLLGVRVERRGPEDKVSPTPPCSSSYPL